MGRILCQCLLLAETCLIFPFVNVYLREFHPISEGLFLFVRETRRLPWKNMYFVYGCGKFHCYLVSR